VCDDWNRLELWSGDSSEVVNVGKDMGFTTELETFFRSAKSGGAWPIDWQQLRAGSWAAFAALESISTGLPVELDADDNDA